MDHLSIAASIVEIATAGIKVSIKLATLASSTSTAAGLISSIGSDVSLTSAILHQLGDLMSQKTSDGDLPLFSKAGLESTECSAGICQKIFEEIERETVKANNVIKGRKGPIDGKMKLTRAEKREWPFLQPSIEVLRTEFMEAKGTLLLMLQVTNVLNIFDK